MDDQFTRFDRRLAYIMAEIEYAERPVAQQLAGVVYNLPMLRRILHVLRVNNPDLKSTKRPLTDAEAILLWPIEEDGLAYYEKAVAVPLSTRLHLFFQMPGRRYVPFKGKRLKLPMADAVAKPDSFAGYLADRKAVASAAFDLFPMASGQEES